MAPIQIMLGAPKTKTSAPIICQTEACFPSMMVYMQYTYFFPMQKLQQCRVIVDEITCNILLNQKKSNTELWFKNFLKIDSQQ